MRVALSCISITSFLVKGTAPAKKKPIYVKITINTQADFELCPSTEEDGEIGVLAISRKLCHCSGGCILLPLRVLSWLE